MANITSTAVSEKATPITGTAVKDLLSGVSTTAEYYANSKAYTTQAEGDTAEATAYTTSAAIDTENVSLTGISTLLKQADEARTLTKTLGTQAADVAGAGLGTGGTAAFLLRDSARQGAYKQQLTGYEGNLAERDYTNEGLAATAQADASTKAATAATDLATTESEAGDASKTNSLNAAYALLQNASPTDKNYDLVTSISDTTDTLSTTNTNPVTSISKEQASNLYGTDTATGEGTKSTAAGGTTEDTADTTDTTTTREDEVNALSRGKSGASTTGVTTIGNSV